MPDLPATGRGLLARLDDLVDLVGERRGLALAPDGRLARAEADLVARRVGHDPPCCRPLDPDVASIELLRDLAEALGLLRTRGARLEVAPLRAAWVRLDAGVRTGLVFAVWCNRVPWVGRVGTGPVVEALSAACVPVLRLLASLPAGVDVEAVPLAATVAAAAGIDAADPVLEVLACAFLDPLVALGVASLEPLAPLPPRRLRLGPNAFAAIGSALLAAGEDVPLWTAPVN